MYEHKNCAQKWCQKFYSFLFEVTCKFRKRCRRDHINLGNELILLFSVMVVSEAKINNDALTRRVCSQSLVYVLPKQKPIFCTIYQPTINILQTLDIKTKLSVFLMLWNEIHHSVCTVVWPVHKKSMYSHKICQRLRSAYMTKKKLLVETNLNYEPLIWDGSVEELRKKLAGLTGPTTVFF